MTETNKSSRFSAKSSVMSFFNKEYNKLIVLGILAVIVIVGITGCNLFGGKVAATVNGTKIYLSDVDKQYNTYVKQLTAAKQPVPTKDQANNIKSMILDRLIRDEVIKQAADKDGVQVSQKEVDKGVQQIKASTTPDQLAKGLKQMGWTEDDLAIHVKAQIVETKLRQKKTKGINVSEKEASEYYKQNKVNYKVPEQIKVAIAKVTSKSDADKIASEGKDDFTKAAQKYSKTGYQAALPQSKDQLKFSYGDEFANEVFNLNNGDMTDVIKVNGGYAIANAEGDVIAGHQKTFKEVKQEVIAMLKSQKEQQSFEGFIQDFKNKAEIKILIDELKPQTQPQFPTGHPNTGQGGSGK